MEYKGREERDKEERRDRVTGQDRRTESIRNRDRVAKLFL